MASSSHTVAKTTDQINFTFTGGQKLLFGVLMLIGVICSALAFFNDPADEAINLHHSRFWTNFLHNSAFFGGLGFISLFLLCCKILAYSGWHTTFKRIWEAMMMFLPVSIVFFAILAIGNFAGFHHIYHWAAEGVTDPNNKEAYDSILAGKAPFLNPLMYLIFTVVIVLVWSAFAFILRARSKAEDKAKDGELSFFKKNKVLAAIFLPIGGFSSAAFIWLLLMSIDSHWYSTMYAWYVTASWLVSAVAFTILLLVYLKSKGYFPQVTKEHMHDLGKYLFGFSVFWTYLWFSQFMLIWYANVGEETVYFDLRIEEYPFLFYGNLVINFALPFIVLLANSTKRMTGTLVLVASLVFFGHWMDFFQMVKPGVYYENYKHLKHSHGHDGHHDEHHDTDTHLSDAHNHDAQAEGDDHSHAAVGGDHKGDNHDGHSKKAKSSRVGYAFPGFIEIGMMLGWLGLFLFVVFSGLARAQLVPTNDPYINESMHHHV